MSGEGITKEELKLYPAKLREVLGGNINANPLPLSDEDYLEKEKAKFVLFKPAAKFNSSNPNFTTCESTSYKIVPASNGLYRTPAMQYRCCRKKH